MKLQLISKTDITKNLRSLNYKYEKCNSLKDKFLYSKLAILELCGWIEISMDDLVLRCAKDNLKNAKNIKFIQDQVVKRNYGFEYEKHFRNMISNVIGLKNFEIIENSANKEKIVRLKSALQSLKTERNSHAHTYIRSSMVTISAPSVTKMNFTSVYAGLIEFDETLRNKELIKSYYF